MLRYCLLFLLLTSQACFAGQKVLLLNSYHSQFQWTRDNIQGIEQVLNKQIAEEDLFIEFMDTRRFIDDPTHIKALASLYRNKYRQVRPNIIISTDDFALDFLLQYRDEIFPNVPVVFNGVNFDPTEKLKGRKDFIGILEGEAIAQNLTMIADIHKNNINEIIVLSDKSSLSELFSEKVREIQKTWQHNDIKITLHNDFSYESLLYQVNNLSKNKAYFITALHKDNQNRYFSYTHDIPILARYSKAPIYGMWGTPLMGIGIVGGFMNDPKVHGANAAQLALKILSGEPFNDSSIQKVAQFSPQFDARQLKKFSISQYKLPANSEINFIEVSLFEEYKTAVYTVILIILLLIMIIIVLSIQMRKRKLAEKKLAELNNALEDKIVQRTIALESSNRALLKLNSRMENLANTDDLTLIPNRRHGHRILDRLNYIDGVDYSIALMDIDHFKKVNDLHGHELGDQVLQLISQTISQSIRPSDTICRWGGEEFLLIMPTTTIDNALHTCERVRQAIACTPMPPLEAITISIGISNKLQARSINELLRQADKALYKAKNQGRNICISWEN